MTVIAPPRIDETLDRIKDAVGAAGFIADPARWRPISSRSAASIAARRGSWCGRPRPRKSPRSCGCAPPRACRSFRKAAIPGCAAARCPTPTRRGIVLSLGRMNRVRALDPVNYTITVEAGAILADVQRAAAEADRLFPLSLGAEGTCQIGGNLSTNAGGIAVLRYGNMRELTLGPRSGAAGRRGVGRAQGLAQGQYRLRPEAALHRRRGHARHHHRGDAQALPAAARGRDRVPGPRPRRGRDGALRPRPRRDRRSAHRLRADPAHRPRDRDGAYPGRARSAGRAHPLVRAAWRCRRARTAAGCAQTLEAFLARSDRGGPDRGRHHRRRARRRRASCGASARAWSRRRSISAPASSTTSRCR